MLLYFGMAWHGMAWHGMAWHNCSVCHCALGQYCCLEVDHAKTRAYQVLVPFDKTKTKHLCQTSFVVITIADISVKLLLPSSPSPSL